MIQNMISKDLHVKKGFTLLCFSLMGKASRNNIYIEFSLTRKNLLKIRNEARIE